MRCCCVILNLLLQRLNNGRTVVLYLSCAVRQQNNAVRSAGVEYHTRDSHRRLHQMESCEISHAHNKLISDRHTLPVQLHPILLHPKPHEVQTLLPRPLAQVIPLLPSAAVLQIIRAIYIHQGVLKTHCSVHVKARKWLRLPFSQSCSSLSISIQYLECECAWISTTPIFYPQCLLQPSQHS